MNLAQAHSTMAARFAETDDAFERTLERVRKRRRSERRRGAAMGIISLAVILVVGLAAFGRGKAEPTPARLATIWSTGQGPCLSPDDPRYIPCSQALQVAQDNTSHTSASPEAFIAMSAPQGNDGNTTTVWVVRFPDVVIRLTGGTLNSGVCLVTDWFVKIDATTGSFLGEGASHPSNSAAPTEAAPSAACGQSES
jgi:hypothetical protein